MAINFPTSLDTLTNPASNNTLDSPSHSGQHSDVNDAIEAIEAKVGADGSAVNTTHDFKLSGVSDGDYAVSLAGEETLTNKTLTTPVINGAVTGTMTPPKTFYGANFIAPEGFLLNGKIVPSVASNNLTVALKGLDGNDPSATNPIYVRIGDTVHSITGALSLTLGAGYNFFNAGSTDLATKEIDYFVYLIDDTNRGLKIGVGRVPYYTAFVSGYGGTDARWIATTSGAKPDANDPMVVIGRFAATLSAGAGYTWTVPTFTTANLIQRPIFETRQLEYVPTVAYSGGSTGAGAFTYNIGKYKIDGGRIFVDYWNYVGTTTTGSNRTGMTFTVPIVCGGGTLYRYYAAAQNNAAGAVTMLQIYICTGDSVCTATVAMGSAQPWGYAASFNYPIMT